MCIVPTRLSEVNKERDAHIWCITLLISKQDAALGGQQAGESARRDRRGFSSDSLSARNELKGALPALPALPVVVHDHAADVFAIAHCLVADVDVIECVGVGDELVELERAVLVHAKQARDVAARVR